MRVMLPEQVEHGYFGPGFIGWMLPKRLRGEGERLGGLGLGYNKENRKNPRALAPAAKGG